MNLQETTFDGVVTKQVAAGVQKRLLGVFSVERKLLALARTEPHLSQMLESSLIALKRLMRRTGAPADLAELSSTHLRRLSARLLAALKLADSRYRRPPTSKGAP